MYNKREGEFMKYLLIILLLGLTLFSKNFKNDLQFESSPYLKQHESNRIEWMPWGEEAFAKAKKEHKAVFLSIGYSTCHWCHVMAKEAFENEEVAQVFNDNFVCIKVDREEFPHLDSYYQQLHLKVNKRSGGWPLSAFLTYDKKPFYVATYIPLKKEVYHEGLERLLPRIAKKYKEDFPAVQKQAKAIESIMNKPLELVKNEDAKISVSTLINALTKEYDTIYGGFGKQRKFPEASKLGLMMDLALLSGDKKLLQQSLNMLDAMALHGLYDHVEGGFFRYSVDAAWEIPHFEKMLYNQAELIPLYVKAYFVTKKELYKEVVEESIAFLDKRFVEQNLYYSASDADTHHEEGGYFIFTKKEIEEALSKNPHKQEIEESLEHITEGNFEGKVHLNFFTNERPKGFELFVKELLGKRSAKEYPFIDKKINTAWNAMMIEALYRASLLDKRYAQKADEHLLALQNFMFERGELYHQSLVENKPKQLGLLEDYAFLISALIAGYESDYSDEKLDFAEYLLNKAQSKFYKDGIWYLSDDDLRIKADMRDKYYTSALAKMLQNYLKMASLKESFRYEKIVITSLEAINAALQREQSDAPATATAFMMQSLGVVMLKNTKEQLIKEKNAIQKIKYPYVLTKKSELDEYLACTMRSCFAKEKELKNIEKSIDNIIRN
jgi:uncharacterized protein YyaL (SSP411 family)